ncbi:hypothetical protein MMC11_000148 [Xylographa trunciseda]|nr:hypothetical protein [Xylographa trunciseda]
MATPAVKIYHGNCHCAAFKFALKVPEITSAHTCNCSICYKKGYLWLYPPTEAFTIERGEGSLTEYHSADKAFIHKVRRTQSGIAQSLMTHPQFCPTCGTPVMATTVMNGNEMIAVNLRTLRDFDVWALDPYPNPNPPMDGASRPPVYVPPKFPGPDIRTEAEKGELELYIGNCHCGAVMVAVKSKPISEIDVNEDDCSICIRNANILIYPLTSHVAIHGREYLTCYMFGKRIWEHRFCRICGVSVCINARDPGEEVKKTWSPEQRESEMEALTTTSINIRILQGVDVRDAKAVKIQRCDMASEPPLYTVD